MDHFADVPEPYYSAIFQTSKMLAPVLKDVTGCNRVCSLFIGFDVPHCHCHLLPAFGIEDVRISKNPQATPEELKSMQEKILSHLKTHN